MNQILLRLAKTWIGGVLLHWIFAYFSFLIPGERLIDNESLLAFHHPRPSYPVHILIVPREKIISLEDLPTMDGLFEAALFGAVNDLVKEFDLARNGYRLIANGGKYQEVGHLHFHLVSGDLTDGSD